MYWNSYQNYFRQHLQLFQFSNCSLNFLNALFDFSPNK